MSKIVTIKADSRGQAGKGAARSVRRTGAIPGVVYGDKQDPQLIQLTYNAVLPFVETGRFLSTLVDLVVDGKTIRAIPRDIQFEPVKDRIIHVDFLRLGKDSRIAVEIPVHFKNQDQAPGLKSGGVLNVVSHSVNLYCPADFIPDEIVVDLAGMQIGQNVHLSQIQLPDRVTSVSREDLTLCAITAQAKEEEAPAEAASAEVPATAQKAPAAAAGAAAAAPAKGGAAPAAAKGAAPAAAAPAKKK
ncbi:MAG: 50S ribosomal protein L25/general stress protein Ctc [Proteobacteria bacterium]|nr:50S ribosomal protein L25/general stress protein Ctc [Pseudomonadota bacterium]